MKYLFLGLAIVFEVTGTAFLNASNQFTKLIPSVLVLLCFCSCFYFLSLSLKELSLGTAYAIWAGLGIILTSTVSYFVFKQKLDLPAIIGIALIVVGVVVINFFSKTTGH